jgi:predicted dehydrogenase
VSIVDKHGERTTGSADVESHSKTGGLLLHHGALDTNGEFVRKDEWLDTTAEPDHDGLCLREQQSLLHAIRTDEDLGEHLAEAVNSLRIVLAADRAAREGRTIDLE